MQLTAFALAKIQPPSLRTQVIAQASLAMIADVDADPERRATWRGVSLFNHGRSSFALGDRAGLNEALDEALLLLTDAARESAELDTLALDATVRVSLARVQLRLGEVDAAWRGVATMLDHARASGEIGALLLSGRTAWNELAAAPAPPEHAQRKAWLQTLLEPVSQAAPDVPSPRSPQAAPASVASGTTERGRADVLTERENDVLALIAAGDSNKLIARALDLSPHTVTRHVANILDKLALESRGKAAAWYQARG